MAGSTIFLLIQEKPHLVLGSLSKRTAAAVLRVVRVILAEEPAGLCRITVQTFAGGIFVFGGESTQIVHGLISLLAGAFAAPSFPGMVALPEWIVDRKGEFLTPEKLMYLIRHCRYGLSPSEVRIDIYFCFEVLPVRCPVRSDDSCVVLGVQPLVAVLAGERSHITTELLVGFETAFVIEQLHPLSN